MIYNIHTFEQIFLGKPNKAMEEILLLRIIKNWFLRITLNKKPENLLT